MTVKIMFQILEALNYQFENGMVNHNLEPANVLVDDQFNLKLFNHGLYDMTNGGDYVPFPIGNVRYMAPERILGGRGNIKSDVWSFGLISAEVLLECQLWTKTKLPQVMRKIISFCGGSQSVLEKLGREHDCMDKLEAMNKGLRAMVESCLRINPRDRPTLRVLLANEIFNERRAEIAFRREDSKNPLLKCPLEQIYYWWQLAGGDVQTELKKEGLIRSEAPILLMPKIVFLNGVTIGPPKSQSFLFDNRLVSLRLTNLIERLKSIEPTAYYPLLYSPKFPPCFNSAMETLPLVIRERDTEYQFYRTILFLRLLKAYPYTRDKILEEAEKDIPPLLRGHIWACLLGVIENGSFEKIDKISPTSTDRQIDVDIPRCHQYDEILSSPEGHRKLKRLLKAWVIAHPQYVYWQGLDSLTAPFIYLNFTNEGKSLYRKFALNLSQDVSNKE